MREFETGATRDNDTEKLDYEGFISPVVEESFAQYMHAHRRQADGQLRASDNWQKGIPVDAYMKSLIRHTFELWLQYRSGQLNLEILHAIRFNVQGLAFEILHEAPEVKFDPVKELAQRQREIVNGQKNMANFPEEGVTPEFIDVEDEFDSDAYDAAHDQPDGCGCHKTTPQDYMGQ